MSSDARSRLSELSEKERRLLLNEVLKKRQAAARSGIPVQPRAGASFPLGYAQQRIWLIQQLFPETTTFSVVQGLRLRGRLDRDALRAALAELVRRHEVLRTSFHFEGEGEPAQRVESIVDVPMPVDDLRGLPEDVREVEAVKRARVEGLRPWNLASAPLIRTKLWQIDDEQHVLLLAMHHIVCDGWSMGVLTRDLFACYEARAGGRTPALPPLTAQGADFAVWQREWLKGRDLETQLGYWRQRMAGAPALRLPASAADDGAAATGFAKGVRIPADATRKLKAVGNSEGVSLFMSLFGILSILLSRYAGQDDVVVGSPLANRTRPELEHVVGCFMNPLPFRLDVAGNPTYRDLLKRVRESALGVYANQDVPFDVLVRALQPKRDATFPLYQAMFLLHSHFGWAPRKLDAGSNVERSNLEFAPWPILPLNIGGEAQSELAADRVFPVALQLFEMPDGLAGYFEYAPEFARVLERAPEDFRALAEAAAETPERRIDELVQRVVAKPHASASAPAPAGLVMDGAQAHELFEAQAARTPDAIAIEGPGQRLTYGDLQARVARLASYLQAEHAGSDAPVGVLLDRSVEAVIALLAVLRAGGSYLPLDPALPADRLAYMLDHAGVRVVITRESLLRERGVAGDLLEGRVAVRVDADAAAIGRQAIVAGVPMAPGALAYVLYTSGSMGRPKAVEVPRGALGNYVRVAAERFELGPSDRALQFASLSFDTAAEEIFPTLASGAALVLRSDAMITSAPGFLATCADWGITVLNFPTAYWHELTAQIARGELRVPTAIRLVIIGGERALSERVHEWRAAAPAVRLLNTYGPTETTIVATMCDLTALESGRTEPPIGRAIPNADVHVLDETFAPAAVGAAGEIYIGGAGLARGYLGQPALTAERFVPDPVSGRPGARLYRTGDAGRRRTDGQIEFAGRLDDQIKLRGYRIEPGEIEAALAAHPGIREVAVILREDEPHHLRLVAYVAAHDPEALDAAAVRAFAGDRLPDYMVPAAVVFLAHLPRTVQGKIDRRHLPKPATSGSDDGYIAPETDVERTLAVLWAEVLHRDRVGVRDNFFDLGGHSLLVIQLHARLTQAFGNDLSLVDLFRYSTIQSQAARLTKRKDGAAPAMASVRDRAARQRAAFSAGRRAHGER